MEKFEQHDPSLVSSCRFFYLGCLLFMRRWSREFPLSYGWHIPDSLVGMGCIQSKEDYKKMLKKKEKKRHSEKPVDLDLTMHDGRFLMQRTKRRFPTSEASPEHGSERDTNHHPGIDAKEEHSV